MMDRFLSMKTAPSLVMAFPSQRLFTDDDPAEESVSMLAFHDS